MRYLLTTSSSLHGESDDLGIIIGPRVGGIRPIKEGRWWAADNDAFHGKFDEQVFENHLARLVPYRDRCLFVVTPDVLGDPHATLQQFHAWAPVLMDGGFPPAFVLQDGSEHLPIPDAARALFLGGSTAWKAANIGPGTIRAHERSLHMHVGRVNSLRRVRECASWGVDSVDGTYTGFRGLERGVREVTAWMEQANNSTGLYALRSLPCT